MSRVGKYRLTAKGVAAMRKAYRESHWASVQAFCDAVGIQHATYYKLTGRKAWFEEATIKDKLKSIGAAVSDGSALYECKDDLLNPQASTQTSLCNLPGQSTSFIGRETEKASVKARLANTRMLTLTGAGGCGKTRLALQVAGELIDDYSDGVRFVDFASITDSNLVEATVLSGLGLVGQPGSSLIETVTAYLRERVMLLILDNCEHLLDACARLVARLLSDCPHVKILATSRESRHIEGEMVWSVPSLSLPTGESRNNNKAGDSLEEYTCDAVRLFVERAHAAKSDFDLDGQNGPHVVEICSRLDGIPLAIELAAARVRSIAVEDICSRLDWRFHLLTREDPNLLPRQQTLTASIKWSYELLASGEQAILDRLSVFAAGWTLAAAEHVCADSVILTNQVCGLMTSLVDKSLVIFDKKSGDSRYRLLETVRQFAEEMLLLRGETEAVRALHCDYFVALAREVEPKLESPHQDVWFRRLTEDYGNLRRALDWSLQAGRSKDGLRMCGSLKSAWETLGYHSEGRQRCAQALAIAAENGHEQERANALDTAGVLATAQGDYEFARAHHEESLDICSVIGDKRGIASALGGLGFAAMCQGDFDLAESRFEESLAISREIGQLWDIGRSLLNLGNVAESRGDYASAQKFYEESLIVRRQIGDHKGIAYSLLNLGNVADCYGDFLCARNYYEQSVDQFREIGDRRGIATSINYLGNSALYLGDYTTATKLYVESTSINREIGNRGGFSHSLNSLGAAMHCEGDYAAAMAHHKESLSIRREIGVTRGIAASLIGVGYVYFSQGDLVSAWDLFEESLSLFELIQDRGGAAWAHYCLGNAACSRGHCGAARTHHNEGMRLYLESEDRGGISRSLDALGSLFAAENRPLAAANIWGASQAMLEKTGSRLLPYERLMHDRLEPSARTALGEEVFLAAWEEGRNMSLEQAVELALSKCDG